MATQIIEVDNDGMTIMTIKITVEDDNYCDIMEFFPMLPEVKESSEYNYYGLRLSAEEGKLILNDNLDVFFLHGGESYSWGNLWAHWEAYYGKESYKEYTCLERVYREDREDTEILTVRNLHGIVHQAIDRVQESIELFCEIANREKTPVLFHIIIENSEGNVLHVDSCGGFLWGMDDSENEEMLVNFITENLPDSLAELIPLINEVSVYEFQD